MDSAEDSPKTPSKGQRRTAPPGADLPPGAVEDLPQAILEELRLAAPRPDRVAKACSLLRERIGSSPGPPDPRLLVPLLPLLRERGGEVVAPLFGLLEETAATCVEPWPLLEGMLRARDHGLALRGVRLAARLAGSGSLRVTRRVVGSLAEMVEAEDSGLAGPGPLTEIAAIVCRLKPGGPEDEETIPALYREGEARVRRLAARLLDLDGRLPSAERAARLIGTGTFRALAPYLDYTRASHLDLLFLAPAEGEPAPVVAAVSRAEKECGEATLREVLSELGWDRVNLGLEVRRVLGISVGGSFPFLVSPAEAPLLESLEGARRVSDSFLFVAHGGKPGVEGPGEAGEGPVARFREYNLLHARVLGEILDVAPLTGEKILRILGSMDAIVEHFTVLFGSHTDEARILGAVYGELRKKILSELDAQISRLRLSAELTRLVQAFEDPRNLGEVRTLHGLKRYLHQRGLQLAFRLVETGGATNRTVDLVVATPRRPLRRGRGIRYADFEPSPAAESPGGGLPYPVALAAEEFGRQLLHGVESLPEMRVFCYGNEVHYYLTFANHPAFLRIDYAPPLQGGMIDLEYFGVSKYELSVHPNPSLEVIRRFFRDLEFDVRVESTRINARYDKERALDLGDLGEKAEAIFRLAPYLMEVDWVIGALDLDAGAKGKVAEAWARSFSRWGVLPLRELLTRDRRGILSGVEAGPGGEREIPWSGQGPYRDRFAPVPAGLLAGLASALRKAGLRPPPALVEESEGPPGQIGLERLLLRPLREARARGEIVATPGGPRPRSPDLFQKEDEAIRFAEILDGDDGTVAAAARLARQVAPLERALRFRTTGSLNGHEVQQARLALRGGAIALYVLRDAGGMIRLALFAEGEILFRSREEPSLPWFSNGSTEVSRLVTLLRANSYLAPGAEGEGGAAGDSPGRIRELFRRRSRLELPAPFPGERVVSGLRASPGRAVGRARFPAAGRKPEDLDGCVLVAAFLKPEDNTFLFHSEGVVSTGGGILSHAGLIAIQFRKPSLIIPGRWTGEADGSTSLFYRALEYREETREAHGFRVSLRRETREREQRLREGDLLALDADEGTLRVLGQDRDTLALHEGLRALRELDRRLARPVDEGEVLNLRGRRLRAEYQSERILGRLADPAVARHAVRELLLGEAPEGEGGGRGRAHLLSMVLRNPTVSDAARGCLLQILAELDRRRQSALEEARERIPLSPSPHEVLTLRLEMLRLGSALEEASRCAAACGLEAPPPAAGEGEEVDHRARVRLAELRDACYCRVQAAEATAGGRPGLRHALRQIERLDRVLGNPGSGFLGACRERLAREDEEALRRAEGRRIVGPEDGGFELAPLIGWKAANLAEGERLLGERLAPPWFVVTHRAFAQMLDAPPGERGTAEEGEAGSSTLRAAIDGILGRPDLDDTRKSALIRRLWETAVLPEDLAEEVLEAYARLGRELPPEAGEEDRSAPFVAIRSSGREEDAETAARAGEFETFLFVRGGPALLQHLKRAWSGLWTERAIHNRAVLAPGAGAAGGGVIVQRTAWSRVSGVLQTVNVAEGEVREMVINAGLGLGEGIVSGTVAADHVVVSKEGDLEQGPLRFQYITGDKREKVVFNRREGLGTARVETLYHQRLRPALEYVELAELVRAAARLEAVYGYPLDIEFGIEGTRLWILQIRPVVTHLSVLGDTLERHPLSGARRIAS